jgi:hypothetical protein
LTIPNTGTSTHVTTEELPKPTTVISRKASSEYTTEVPSTAVTSESFTIPNTETSTSVTTEELPKPTTVILAKTSSEGTTVFPTTVTTVLGEVSKPSTAVTSESSTEGTTEAPTKVVTLLEKEVTSVEPTTTIGETPTSALCRLHTSHLGTD